MLRASLLIAALVYSATAAAPTYTWFDQNGIQQFSDRPVPGAVEVKIQGAQTYSAPKPAVVATPVSANITGEPFKYASCAIGSPTNDQVFLNVSSVSLNWRFEPRLRTSDRVQLFLDGQVVPGVPFNAASFTVAPIPRGTHTAAVSVQDSAGKVVCRSADVTFHVRQPSVLAPANPNRPRPQPRPR